MVDIHCGYQFITPVVGESHYFDNLRLCYTDKKAFRKGKSVFIDAVLMLEDDNPYDDMAVVVMTVYGEIGYLSRNHARLYRQDYGTNLSVRTKIFSRDGTIFGAWVDLPYDEYDKPKKPRKPKKPKQSKSELAVSSPIKKADNKPPITLHPPPPKEPPKPWNQLTLTEKIFAIIVYVIFAGIALVVLVFVLSILMAVYELIRIIFGIS